MHEKPLSKWRLILSVFLPFAAGYYLAYLFRTINAAISPALASDFALNAAETGLLASIYFLVFGLTQFHRGASDRLGRVEFKACCWSSRLAAQRCSVPPRASRSSCCARHDRTWRCRLLMAGLRPSHLVSERARRARQRLDDHVGIARRGHGDRANRLVAELCWLAQPV